MKKKVLIGMAALVLALAGVLAYFELRYPSTESKEVSMTEKEILVEMPDISISEMDLALGERLRASAEIQELLTAGEITKLPERLTKTLLGDYPTEEWSWIYINTSSHGNIYVDFMTEEKRAILTFNLSEEFTPQKVIALYSIENSPGEKLEAMYENNEGSLKKYVEQRRWFSYFRDRMWEN